MYQSENNIVVRFLSRKDIKVMLKSPTWADEHKALKGAMSLKGEILIAHGCGSSIVAGAMKTEEDGFRAALQIAKRAMELGAADIQWLLSDTSPAQRGAMSLAQSLQDAGSVH